MCLENFRGTKVKNVPLISLEHSDVKNIPHIQAFPGSLNAGIFFLPIVILVQILLFSSIDGDCCPLLFSVLIALFTLQT